MDAEFLAGLDRPALIAAMRQCPQTPAQSVLDHGRSVWAHARMLLAALAHGEALPDWWRIPDWTRAPGLLERLAPRGVMAEYAIFHDCGKPGVMVVDADGRRHFPGHAAASERAWLAAGGHPLAARLMGMDMDAHLLKGEGVDGFAARPEAATLLIMALAEVHSNAAMFGGTASDGFKIKAKHLDRRGRQVIAAMIRDGLLPAAPSPGGAP